MIVKSEPIRINGEVVQQVHDAREALRLLAIAEMKPFTPMDWDAFAGCESKEPLIGEVDDFAIVLDDNVLLIVHGEDNFGGVTFEMKEK